MAYDPSQYNIYGINDNSGITPGQPMPFNPPVQNVPVSPVDQMQNIPSIQQPVSPSSQQPPSDYLNQVLAQQQQDKQAQQNNGGLIQQILSNRSMQPTMQDIGQSLYNSVNSLGAPDQFKAEDPNQAMNNRINAQLSPYTAAIGAAYAQPNAAADLALKQGQAQYYQSMSGGLFGGNPMGGAATGPGGQQLTGEDFLKTLDPTTAAMVKSYAMGTAAPLTPQSLRTPQAQQLMRLIYQYDPTFDATNYGARVKTAKDFSPGGVSGQKITQAQTTINHLASLMDASDKLGGFDASFASPAVNAVGNYFQNQNQNLINYNRYSGLAGDEIAKFTAGAGGSTIEDRNKQASQLSINNSPPARKAAAQSAIQAIFGKLEPIVSQYNQTYGTQRTPFDFLSKETQQSLAKLGMTPEGYQANGPGASIASPSNGGGKVINFSDLPQ